MAEILNLRQARKTRARADKERVAEANRARFGRSKSERLSAEKQANLDSKRLDLHKRQSDDDD